MRSRLTALAGTIGSLEKQLSGRFPAYSSLANQKPLAAKEVQSLLQPQDALVLSVPGRDQLAHLCGHHKRHDLERGADGTTAAHGKKSARFEKGLDIDAAQKSVNDGKPDLFDLAGSSAMYRLLFGSDSSLKDKRHLIIVPHRVFNSAAVQSSRHITIG